ncbi:MAG: TRAP transporter large permease subunit [Desulfotignum sp.]|nr:TRAP transporter large permease subunit [Desulfotignum sp.]
MNKILLSPTCPNSCNSNYKNNTLDITANGLERLITPVTKTMMAVSAITLGIMSIPIFLDVIARLVLHKSMPGIIELEEFFMVVIVFLALGATHGKEGHISIELLTSRLSARVKDSLDLFNNITGTFFFGLMTFRMALATVKKAGEYSVMLQIPVSLFMGIAVLGLGTLTLVLLIKLIRAVSILMKTKNWTGLLLALTASVLLLSFPLWYGTLPVKPSRLGLGGMGMGFMMILLLAGMPIGFAMSIVGFLGLSVISFSITPALMTLGTAPYSTTASFILAVAPLFIFMGLLASEAGISQDLFDTANKWLGRLPGGLAMAAIAGCSGFAAVCGDSMATAVTMGSVSLPEMKRKRYSSGLACGALAAGGTLGILIPPSVGFIFYALVTEESVGKLFVAGIVPGILLTFMFMASIWCIALVRPDLAPRGESFSLKEKLLSLKGVIGMLVLFVIILGGILAGIFSPTEGGGIGVIGSTIIMALRGRLNWQAISRSCDQAVSITARLLMILIGVSILGYFLAASRLPFELAKLVTQNDLNRYLVLASIMGLFALLGCLMNVIPMILLTLPAIFPTVLALGFDPIWFGVLTVIIMEMGQITPPIGVNVFAISSVAEDVSMGAIFLGIIPFFLCMIVCLIALTLFPQLATWLVGVFY